MGMVEGFEMGVHNLDVTQDDSLMVLAKLIYSMDDYDKLKIMDFLGSVQEAGQPCPEPYTDLLATHSSTL